MIIFPYKDTPYTVDLHRKCCQENKTISPFEMWRKKHDSVFFSSVRAGVLPVDRPQLQRDVHPGRPGPRQLRLHTPRHGQWSSEREWRDGRDGRDSNPLKIAQWKRTTDRRFCSVLQPAPLFCFLPVSGTLMLLMMLLLGFIYLFVYFCNCSVTFPSWRRRCRRECERSWTGCRTTERSAA